MRTSSSTSCQARRRSAVANPADSVPQCEPVPHRLDEADSATFFVEMRAALALVAATTAAACSYGSDEETSLERERAESQLRWISIDVDALDTARTIAPIDSVEVAGNIALVQVNELDLGRLSRMMHEQHQRCGGFVVHDTLQDARLALGATDGERTVYSVVPYTIDNAAT